MALIIGHRGARAGAPENTLAGLRKAAAEGASGVEFDVMLTRDGVPVLMHDDTVDRTTDGRGPLADLSLEEVRALDAGCRFPGGAFAGEPVPTLEEALIEAQRLNLSVNIEIKPSPGTDRATAEAALAVARRVWRAPSPPLISSFSVPALEVARDQAPDWPRGYLFEGRPADWAATAARIGASTLNIPAATSTPADIAAYKASGRPVLAWTVNNDEQARALVAAGVDGLITDRPAGIIAALSASARPAAGPGTPGRRVAGP